MIGLMPIPTQCGVSGQLFKDEDIVVVELVPGKGFSDDYPRFVLEQNHDESLEVLEKMTYSELKAKWTGQSASESQQA